MKYLNHNLDNELILMRDYKIYPNELFTIKVILLAQDGEYEYLQQYVQCFENKNYLTIDENGLDQVLRGEVPNLYQKKLGEVMFRF